MERKGDRVSSGTRISRREFLKLTGLAGGAALIASCAPKVFANATEVGPTQGPTNTPTPEPSLTPKPTRTPTPEPSPTPDPAKERITKVLSQEDVWLSAGVPKEKWDTWKQDAEKGKISPDFETFAAQASIVEKLLSEGKIQSSTSLDKINPADLSFKVEFVKSESGEMPVVFAVDNEGGAYIASLNKPINEAGFPKLNYKEMEYANLFKVPELVGLKYELVNFNQVLYKGFIKEKNGSVTKMPDLLMTPQDLYSGEGFEKFYWNGLYRQWEVAGRIDNSFNGIVGKDYLKMEEDVYEGIKVSKERPSVAIYTVAGFDPRTAQKIIGLEYTKEGEERLLIGTVRLVGRINELLEGNEKLKELRPYYVKATDNDPVFTTFWLPPYIVKGKGQLAFRSFGSSSWKKFTNVVSIAHKIYIGSSLTPTEAAANEFALSPTNELDLNGKLYVYEGYGAFRDYVPTNATLKSLIEKAKVINNNDTSDGEIGYMHFLFWIFRQLGLS